MLSIKIKKWTKDSHKVDEHLDFIYSVLYELADRVEELEKEMENTEKKKDIDEVKVQIRKFF